MARPGRPAVIGDRTGINAGRTLIGGNRTLIGGNRTNIGGTRITNINRNTNINRSSSFTNIDLGSRFVAGINRFNRPWWDLHRGWYHGGWGNWPYYPSFWAGLTGGALLTPWAVGPAFVYSNPYYVASSFVSVDPEAAQIPALDYSEPIAVPTEDQAKSTDEDTVTDAMNHFAQARALFQEGRYAEATAEADTALQELPGDRSIHEFRALTLFARGLYEQAAASIYAVLAGGPGWDWATMAALYDDPATYTAQLRALEAFIWDHPRDAATRFLLGYHYLVMDDREAALSQLRVVLRLKPEDKLSAQLVEALTRQSGVPARE